MSKEKKITGVFESDNGPISFCMENFTFTMMDSEDTMNKSLRPIDGFFQGTTHRYKQIMIPADKEVTIQPVRYLHTNSYILCNVNTRIVDTSQYNKIVFKGGTLNKLFYCNAIDRKIKRTDSEIVIKLNDDHKEYNYFYNDMECKIIVRSNILEELNEGYRINNDEVSLTIEFPEPQPLNTVYNHYGYIVELLSFMTFRRNVGFDDVVVVHCDNWSTSSVHYKQDDELTKKNLHFNISFYDLDDSITELLKIITNKEENKSSHEFGFIPKSDKNFNQVTDDLVKKVCSSIECEMGFIDFTSPKNVELNNLINDIKDIIKAHRDSDAALDSRTYDVMFGSIKHWTESEVDKIWEIHEMFKELMHIPDGFECEFNYDSVCKLVNYRNGITHGRFKIMDTEIAETTFIISQLIYCCILRRIGLDDEHIKHICSRVFM